MNNQTPTYETVTGQIEYTLTSDLVFHYVLQKSKAALKKLVCALKDIDPDDVMKIEVVNPIDLNSSFKETIMDLKLTLNNNEIINIELQMYEDEFWGPRSILYLCRAYDSIGEGDNYSSLKPTTHICITDVDLIEGSDDFYSQYLLLNTKNHIPYSTDFGINMLQLNHIDKATEDDQKNGLVYWAKLFKAETWEEFKALADGNEVIEEVGTLIFELNYDNQAKELMEGRRRYREQLNTSYSAGRIDTENELLPIIAQKDADLANEKAAKEAAIAERDATIKKDKSVIAALEARIKELESLSK